MPTLTQAVTALAIGKSGKRGQAAGVAGLQRLAAQLSQSRRASAAGAECSGTRVGSACRGRGAVGPRSRRRYRQAADFIVVAGDPRDDWHRFDNHAVGGRRSGRPQQAVPPEALRAGSRKHKQGGFGHGGDRHEGLGARGRDVTPPGLERPRDPPAWRLTDHTGRSHPRPITNACLPLCG
jgi:hypothetical protein